MDSNNIKNFIFYTIVGPCNESWHWTSKSL